MSKLFFDHLVNIERIKSRLAELELIEEEMIEMERMIDELIQQRVVAAILDSLHEDHHDEFVDYLHTNPGNEEILEWLKKQVEGMEEIIRVMIEELEEEILREIIN